MSTHAELAAFVAERTGIELCRGGIDRSLASFAARRSAELGLRAESYLALVKATDGVELERLVNAITVGYTWFFRDPGQFAALELLLATEGRAEGRTRIWVPGCSTGEDAYSLALIAAHAGRDVEILGTDLNSRSVEHARRGLYGAWSVRDVDPRFASDIARRPNGGFEVRPEVRSRVSFARHNLIERPPLPSDGASWDIVLCRNVLIYFERETALRVLELLARALAPGGYLVLGASEVVCEVPSGLEACYVAQRLAFRRVAEDRPAAPASERWARDWLLPSAPAATPGRMVSVLPVSGAAIAQSVAPPAPAPPDVETELAQGHRLLEAGDVAGARVAYLEALRRDPTRAEAHMYAGVARYLCGEPELALHNLRAALFLDDRLWPAAFYLALCHENSGHPAEALQAFSEVVKLDERYRAGSVPLGSVFDAWRDDLCAVARRRVQLAATETRRAG